MSLSLVPLLIHDEDVPAAARAELRAAERGPARDRRVHLEAAARALAREAQLDCAEARELVGLAG
jgi:hypothetical protein